MVDIVSSSNKEGEKEPAIKVTGMPGKHVPPGPGGVVGKLNDLIAAVSVFSSSSFFFFYYSGAREGGLVEVEGSEERHRGRED